MTWTAENVARTIEHTLLKPESTSRQVNVLCEEAVAHGFAGVCVNPIHVIVASRKLESCFTAQRTAPAIVAVVGFPSGATRSENKAEEARRAMDDGANEIDMVAHLSALIDGDKAAVRKDIEKLAHIVHQARQGALLKVILETSALTDEQIILGCRCAAEGEADFVKSSTGFHPSGGATVEHVRLLHKHAAPIRVKASGGIQSASQAIAMLDAGATRIGTSSGVEVIRELLEDGI